VQGRSGVFRRVLKQIELVAPRDTTVLLTGETGSGKEIAAQEVHRRSGRRGPLVSVNCAGVPHHLLESEFFGYERGAFTDAGQSRPGLFEKADGGTLFLDEIGEMPQALQPKLLRVLQDGFVTRLGGAAPRQVNVRLIAATNRDLWEQVERREFREDLFYRISVFAIRLPALSERAEDIPEFLQHFVEMFCERDGLDSKAVAPDAVEALQARYWPGNVRELRNAVELAVIRSEDRFRIGLEDFPPPRKAPGMARSMAAAAGTSPAGMTPPGPEASPVTGAALGLSEMVAHFERDLIERTLSDTNGNKSQAAAALQVNRTTLVEKIKRLERDGLLAAG
jgi:transcriptional regulator with GAF, ATPase, and Fis domain